MASQANGNPEVLAFYHPEGLGYLHVRYIGAGVQGTCTLVRSVLTGELRIRKRCDYQPADGAEHWETQISALINHPHVTKSVASHTYTNHVTQEVSVVSYWPFFNCTDVTSILNKLQKAKYPCPEVFWWRVLGQILGALHQTHLQGIIHKDAHLGNIFAHWTENELLPNFYLGDWGSATDYQNVPYRHDDSQGNVEENPNEVNDDEMNFTTSGAQPAPNTLPPLKPPIPSATAAQPAPSLPPLPFPTLDSLKSYQAPSPTPKSLDTFHHISDDYSRLIDATFDHLIPDPPAPRFSPAMDYFTDLLVNLPPYLLSPEMASLERYQHLLTLLLTYIHAEEARCLGSLSPGSAADVDTLWGAFRVVHPNWQRDHAPLTVRSLDSTTFRPGGPWQVAVVDPASYAVRRREGEVVEEEKVACTGEGSRGGVLHRMVPGFEDL